MIIVIRPHASESQIDHVLERIKELGFKPHISRGELRTIIGVIGDENKLQAEPLAAIPGVEQVLPILKPFKLASREFHGQDSVVQVGSVRVGRGIGPKYSCTSASVFASSILPATSSTALSGW